MTLRTGFLAAAAVALIAATSAQVTQSGPAYALKMKWVKGKSYSYSVSYSITASKGQQPMTQKGSYTMSVKDVQKGVATVTTKASVPNVANDTSETVKIDSTGKLVDGNNNSMNVAVLPAKAVKVGEKWTANRKLQQPLPMTLNSTYVFKGVKTVNGKKYAEIAETMTGSSGTISFTGTGTMLLDTAEGMLYKYSTNAKMVVKNDKESHTVPITSVILRTK